MLKYEFTITIAGYGDSQDAAWMDACTAFYLDPGLPLDDNVETIEEPDNEPD
jgi:hypothetical protein